MSDIEEQRQRLMRKARNSKWYNERGSIQAKIKSILNSKKSNVDVIECYFAFETAYKPTDELRVILNRLHNYILLKELY